MNRNQIGRVLAIAGVAACWPTAAMAQSDATTTADQLMALDRGSLKGELTTRYDAGLAAATDSAVVGADDKRFLWASQAKAQCGIALGYLKSGTKDPVSIGKCNEAYGRLQGTVAAAPIAAVAPPPPPPPPPVACNKGPFIVFFDWNSSDITPEAATILDSMASTYAGCGSAGVSLAGYADRSGTDRYNLGLSERRAQAVRQYLATRAVPDAAMTAKGFGETNPRVPTADGVRELQNRRVEVTVQ